jgi:predicted RNA-binding Zn-ribbon protein involved in translation (DUF1610 family)
MLQMLLRWLTPPAAPTPEPPGRVDGDKLIHRLDLTVDASCPCGSQVIHHLTLMTTAECPRCGRTLAIRSIEYHRTKPASVPTPVISIGWVHSDELLRRTETRGVH